MGSVPFRPLSDTVLVKPIPCGITPGGIALADGVKLDGPDRALVVAVGPGRVSEEGNLIPMTVQPGEVVYMLRPYGEPIDITLGGVAYKIVRLRDILGVDPTAT